MYFRVGCGLTFGEIASRTSVEGVESQHVAVTWQGLVFVDLWNVYRSPTLRHFGLTVDLNPAGGIALPGGRYGVLVKRGVLGPDIVRARSEIMAAKNLHWH